MRVEFNSHGDPLLIEFSGPAGSALASTLGIPSKSVSTETKKNDEPIEVCGVTLIHWGRIMTSHKLLIRL